MHSLLMLIKRNIIQNHMKPSELKKVLRCFLFLGISIILI